MKLSLVVPTIGRPSIARTLASLVAQEWRSGDEVLLVGDGHLPHVEELWHQFSLPGKYVEVDGPHGDWGHSVRNLVLPHLVGDYVMALDDDDEMAPGAISVVRKALSESPGKCHMFRMQWAGGLLWKDRELRHENVGTPMFVHPNDSKFGKYAPVRGGDCQFAQETVDLHGGELVWREEIVCHVRPRSWAPQPIVAPPPPPTARPTWAYGVTTVPSRRETTLPRTLASLAAAGFDSPRLRVDDVENDRLYAPGNWWLLLHELWIRSEGGADFYAIFQDDVIAAKGLREHIERSSFPEKVYLNLYVDFKNAPLARGDGGWFYSNQMGRGALGLVFTRDGAKTLLCSNYMVERFVPDPRTPGRHREALDGGVVTAMKRAGYKEMCHNPSLVDHIGTHSTMSSKVWPTGSPLWKGEDVLVS